MPKIGEIQYDTYKKTPDKFLKKDEIDAISKFSELQSCYNNIISDLKTATEELGGKLILDDEDVFTIKIRELENRLEKSAENGNIFDKYSKQLKEKGKEHQKLEALKLYAKIKEEQEKRKGKVRSALWAYNTACDQQRTVKTDDSGQIVGYYQMPKIQNYKLEIAEDATLDTMLTNYYQQFFVNGNSTIYSVSPAGNSHYEAIKPAINEYNELITDYLKDAIALLESLGISLSTVDAYLATATTVATTAATIREGVNKLLGTNVAPSQTAVPAGQADDTPEKPIAEEIEDKTQELTEDTGIDKGTEELEDDDEELEAGDSFSLNKNYKFTVDSATLVLTYCGITSAEGSSELLFKNGNGRTYTLKDGKLTELGSTAKYDLREEDAEVSKVTVKKYRIVEEEATTPAETEETETQPEAQEVQEDEPKASIVNDEKETNKESPAPEIKIESENAEEATTPAETEDETPPVTTNLGTGQDEWIELTGESSLIPGQEYLFKNSENAKERTLTYRGVNKGFPIFEADNGAFCKLTPDGHFALVADNMSMEENERKELDLNSIPTLGNYTVFKANSSS